MVRTRSVLVVDDDRIVAHDLAGSQNELGYQRKFIAAFHALGAAAR